MSVDFVLLLLINNNFGPIHLDVPTLNLFVLSLSLLFPILHEFVFMQLTTRGHSIKVRQ